MRSDYGSGWPANKQQYWFIFIGLYLGLMRLPARHKVRVIYSSIHDCRIWHGGPLDRSGVGSPPIRLWHFVSSGPRRALFERGRANRCGAGSFMRHWFLEPRRRFHAIRYVGFVGGHEQPLGQAMAL